MILYFDSGWDQENCNDYYEQLVSVMHGAEPNSQNDLTESFPLIDLAGATNLAGFFRPTSSKASQDRIK